jgi:sugar phosphate isomerase/epimerase
LAKWGLFSLAAAALAAGAVVVGLRASADRAFDIGVWEYFVRDPDPAAARRKLADTAAAGFEAAITNSFWAPGQREPSAQEVTELRNTAAAAEAAGVKPLLIVQNAGSQTTPNAPELRAEFAAYAASLARQVPAYRDFIIGNEPNLNRFWLPQFGPDGENVAARDYLALLAESYDALKAVSEDIRVIGGALAPRGGDDPDAARHTHSPTQFIRDLGRFYRDSGRDEPVMDAFAHHPYLESSKTSPDFAHPRSTTIALADYAKLVTLLGEAFDGTAQRGSDVPILYTEFGVQTIIPPEKQDAYTNLESPVAADAVSEETQERYYREAFELACDQPTVEGMYIFHVWDEPDLLGWQSGLYYADQTPKTSRDALLDLPSCS